MKEITYDILVERAYEQIQSNWMEQDYVSISDMLDLINEAERMKLATEFAYEDQCEIGRIVMSVLKRQLLSDAAEAVYKDPHMFLYDGEYLEGERPSYSEKIL